MHSCNATVRWKSKVHWKGKRFDGIKKLKIIFIIYWTGTRDENDKLTFSSAFDNWFQPTRKTVKFIFKMRKKKNVQKNASTSANCTFNLAKFSFCLRMFRFFFLFSLTGNNVEHSSVFFFFYFEVAISNS